MCVGTGSGVKAFHTTKIGTFFVTQNLICGKVNIFSKKHVHVLLAMVSRHFTQQKLPHFLCSQI